MALIDPNSKVPKYLQIRKWIFGMIERGKIRVGDKLPTEEEMAKKFAVNRMTVRQALDELISEKMVTRRRGEGTILVAAKPQGYVYELQHITSFNDDMSKLGITPITKTRQFEVIDPSPDVKHQLGLRDGQKVLYSCRIKYALDEAVLIERSYLSFDEFSRLLDMDMDGTLYHMLVENFNIELHHADQVFSAVLMDDDDKEIFNIEVAEPCMKLESVVYDDNNIPVEVLHSLYRGERYKFKAHSGTYLYQK